MIMTNTAARKIWKLCSFVLLLVPTMVWSTPGAGAENVDRLSDLTSEETRVVSLINNLEDDLRLAHQTQVSLESRLEAITRDLIITSRELEETRARLRGNRAKMNERLTKMYVEKGYGFLAVILGAEDLGDMWQRLYFLSKQSLADFRLIEALHKDEHDQASLMNSIQERRQQHQYYLHLSQEKLKSIERLIVENEALRSQLSKEKQSLLQEIMSEAPARYQPTANASAFPGLGTASVSPYADSYLVTASMPERYRTTAQTLTGEASWYGNEFHGMRTANGEVFNENEFTAASPSLPFGTYLGVTYKGRRIIVRINDRGPFVKGRTLDLSKRAAHTLGLGVGTVHMEILKPVSEQL